MEILKVKKNNTILIYSPQGGSGKTTIAINTAIYGALSGKKVLLVDMAIFGSVGSYLRIPQKGGNGLSSILTLLDLKNDVNSIGFNDAVKSSIIKSNIDNLDVLISSNPVKMESIEENYVKTIMESLKSLGYDYIIVDTSSELSEKNLVLFSDANRIIVPVVQDISCGWKTMQLKEVVEKFYLSSEKFGIVVNMCSKYSGFDNAELENELGYRIMTEIPYFKKNYQRFINEGHQIHTMRNKKAQNYFKNMAMDILKVEVASSKVKT